VLKWPFGGVGSGGGLLKVTVTGAGQGDGAAQI